MGKKVCPNTESSEWKELVDGVGEASAYTAFSLNNDEIPTVSEAMALLAKGIVKPKDEQLSSSSDHFKLKRTREQRLLLDLAKASPKTGIEQKKTIDKLIKMNEAYQEFLKVNIEKVQNGALPEETISATKFIGYSDGPAQPEMYESFKLFGTFMHEILEIAQERAVREGKTIKDIYDRAFFDKVYKDYVKKNPFDIINLTEDEMFNMGDGVVQHIDPLNSKGIVILPEVTIVGESATGSKLIGRIDLLAITPSGEIQILDFKTKKMKSMYVKTPGFEKQQEEHRNIWFELGGDAWPVTPRPGTHDELAALPRNTFDTWRLQLDLYDRVLQQNDMTVSKKSIYALMYQIDQDTGEYVGKRIMTFENQDYYAQAINFAWENGRPHFWSEGASEHIKRFEEVMSKAVPIPGETEKKERLKKNPEEAYSFRPSKENMDKFVDDLERHVDGQIQDINRKLQSIREGEENYEKLLKERRSTLSKFAKIVESVRLESHSKKEALRMAVNFNEALETVEADINVFYEISNKAMESFQRIVGKSDKGETDIKKLNREHVEIVETYKKMQTLSQIVSTMTEIMADIEDPANNNNIGPDNPAKRKLVDITLKAKAIESNFREVSSKGWLFIAKTPGRHVFEGVERDLKMALEPQLIKLRKKLKELKTKDGAPSFLKSWKDSVYSWLNKDFKKKLEEGLGPEGKRRISEIEHVEAQIKEIEQKLNDFDGSDRSIQKYIDGITDPKISTYLGAQGIWNSESLARWILMDDYIATASNSDLGMSAFTQMLKNQEAAARESIVNDVNIHNLEKITRDLLSKGHTHNGMNNRISEWRKVVYREPGEMKISDKKVLTLVKPSSEDYEITYRTYEIQTKIFNKEVHELKADYLEKFDKAPKEEIEKAKKAWLDKISERSAYTTEFIGWMLENSNLPYTDEFYELQLGLPEEIRARLQNIYLEREILIRAVGVQNEILLDDADWDRLMELDIEQKKLFQDASQEDEEYARRLEKFEMLYEYDINDRYYNSMLANKKIQFAEDPESFEKWKKEHTVYKPTSEWYEKLNELYEQIGAITSQDIVLSELFEQRALAMRPYKLSGKFQPKYLTDEDRFLIDDINGQIELRKEELQNSSRSPLSKEEKIALKKIGEQIRAIKGPKELNENYVEEFNGRYQVLDASLRSMNKADAALTIANAKGDKKEILEAEKQLGITSTQFHQQEQSFEEWFNKHHLNKYQSIRTSSDIRATRQHKAYNYESLPAHSVRDQYMETVPNPKYYKLKRLKLGNWTLDGVELRNDEIKELQKNPEEVEQLKQELNSEGIPRLITKPGAYNENFIKGPDGIPFPKGVTQDSEGRYVVDPRFRASKNINPKYLDILDDADIGPLYDALTKVYFSLQKKVEGRKAGYNIPGISSSLVENISRDGVIKAFNKQKEIFFDKHIKTMESQHDQVENVFGDQGQRLRMRFTTQLSEELQTEDAIGAILQYATEAHLNIAMQEVAPLSKSAIELLKLKRSDLEAMDKGGKTFITNEKGEKEEVDMAKRLRELNKVIEVLEFESAKALAGQYSSESSRKYQKIASQIFGWTAFVRIGFDLANQTKNYVAGNLQAFLAAGANKNDKYSKKDYLVAKGMIYGYNGFLMNYFSDWGKVSDLHESTMLYRIYNPLQKDMKKYYEDIAGGRKRKFAENVSNPKEMSFMLQEKGDTEIGLTVMYSVMNSHRYPEIESIDPTTGKKVHKTDDEGNVVYVPAHQAYAKNKQGQLVRRTDVDFTEEDETFLRNVIYSEIRRAQGNYAQSDKTHAERELLGKSMFFFRKFLVPGMLNRFGYLRPNWEGGEASLGYWRAVIQSFKYFGPKATLGEFFLGSSLLDKIGADGLGVMSVKDDEGNIIKQDVGDFYKRRVHHARRDAVAMSLLGILGFMLLSFVKGKDDDEELSMLEGNVIRVIWGVKMEAMSMFPVGAGSTEYVKNFTTAIPFVREMNSIIRMGNHAWSLGLAMIINGGEEPDPGYDSEYYQKVWKDAFYSRKSGPFEKGDVKLVKDFTDLTGIKNIRDIFQPLNRIDVLKRLQ